jgi:hypothetical protein
VSCLHSLHLCVLLFWPLPLAVARPFFFLQQPSPRVGAIFHCHTSWPRPSACDVDVCVCVCGVVAPHRDGGGVCGRRWPGRPHSPRVRARQPQRALRLPKAPVQIRPGDTISLSTHPPLSCGHTSSCLDRHMPHCPNATATKKNPGVVCRPPTDPLIAGRGCPAAACTARRRAVCSIRRKLAVSLERRIEKGSRHLGPQNSKACQDHHGEGKDLPLPSAFVMASHHTRLASAATADGQPLTTDVGGRGTRGRCDAALSTRTAR